MIGMSGDADIAGDIGGGLIIWSGDIHLEDSAVIGGDVSVMSGNIDRSAGATIHGNIIAGPKLPKLPSFLEEWGLENVPVQSTIIEAAPPAATGAWSQVSRFLFRLIGATFFTAMIVFLTGLVYHLQPTRFNGYGQD
ncbi:MAG: hypothetical protein R2867_01325 [Caldilineaceae bacterium]